MLSRLLLLFLAFTAPLAGQINPDWTTNHAPFRIAGNLYYVGSDDLAAYLIATPQGNILINTNLSSSVPQIRQNIESLGFRFADTKILLNSQAHSESHRRHRGDQTPHPRQAGSHGRRCLHR